MEAAQADSEPVIVSIIVPARNEELRLGACLKSLTGQAGVKFEIIVVDDGSSDRTREIALSFPEVRVISAGRLPQGWTGKNNAVATGARHARGPWLLFTDADTVHLPYSLLRSLGEAKREKAALLSYSPEQEVDGFWQQAVMPVIFAELASTYRPSEVSDARSPVAAANGQYILVLRKAYDAAGGHAAVAGSLLEDVALARAIKASGYRIFFRYGGDMVRTRMYGSFGEMRDGWTKNLALLFPSPVRLATLRVGEFLAILVGAQATVLAALYGRIGLATLAAVAFLLLCALFVARIRKAHFPSGATAASLIGLPVFAYLLLRSRAAYRRGHVGWKGRVYEASVAAVPSASQETPAASKLA